MNRVRGIVGAVALLCGTTSAARAGERDFVVYVPGMGASAAQARPYLDRFAALLDQRLGWTGGGANFTFVDEAPALGEVLSTHKPGFGLLPPSYFLSLSCGKKAQVTPVAAVVGLAGSGDSAGRYHLVVKRGGATSLEGLKGKRLSSNHLQDSRFLSRVVFDGKVDVDKDFQLRSTSSPITPLKQVDRGEADAALIDDAQLANMKALPFGQDLVAVFSSEELPPFPLVAFEAASRPADRAALRGTLLTLCQSPEGAPVCKEMQIVRFAPVEARRYQAGIVKYCRP